MINPVPIFTLNCNECGAATAYSLNPFTQEQKNIKLQCYLCMLNLCNLSEAFSVTNLADETELYNLAMPSIEGGYDARMRWRTNCISFANSARHKRNALYIASGKHKHNANEK